MQIEFIGLPGSGKTSISKNLVKKYPKKFILGNKFYDSFRLMLLQKPIVAFRSILMSIPVILLCVRALNKSDISYKKKILALLGLFLNIGNYLLCKRNLINSGKIIIWDEIIHQRIFSIFCYSDLNPKKSDLKKYYDWAIKNFKTTPVLVYCDMGILKNRLKNRGVPKRMKTFNSQKLDDVLISHDYAFKYLSEKNKNLFLIDSTNNIEINITIINNYFKNI